MAAGEHFLPAGISHLDFEGALRLFKVEVAAVTSEIVGREEDVAEIEAFLRKADALTRVLSLEDRTELSAALARVNEARER